MNVKKGFVKTIIILVVAVLILSYFGITWDDVVNNSVVRYVTDLFTNFFNL